MKLFPYPNSLTNAITLVIRFNYVFGLRVFEYPRGYPRSVLSLIYILIISVFYSGSYFHLEIYDRNSILLKLEYVAYRITAYIYYVTVILKMIFGWWHSKEVAACYKKILEIDKTLRQLGLAVCYDRIYFMTRGVIIVWFFFIMLLITASSLYFRTHTNVLSAMYSMCMPIIYLTVNYINAFEFYVFSRCLQTKFELINHYLREVIKNLSLQKTNLDTFNFKNYTKLRNFEEQKNILSINMTSQLNQLIYSPSNFVLRKQSPVTSQIESHIPFQLRKELQINCWNQFRSNIPATKCNNHIHLLQIMKQVHLELCKVSKLICSAFGIQIAWEIGVVILNLIHILYRIYCQYIVGTLRSTIEHVYWPLTVCLVNLLKIIFLSRTCKNAADEGNKTTELIRIPYGINTDVDTQEEIQQFGIQILHSPVIFCVFGLTMDNHVLIMILKILTTYIIVIIQITSSLESYIAVKDVHF